METEVEFKAIASLKISHKQGESKSTFIHSDYTVQIPTGQNLDEKMYFNEDGTPTKQCSHLASQIFIQALSANLHYAHEKGYRDSAEHLRYIIAELEKVFATVPKITIERNP